MSDKTHMKRMKYLLNLLALISILMITSCGKDNTTTAKKTTNGSNGSNTETLVGKECGCDSTYMPVSGINSYGATVTYDNICLANCHGLTSIIQGRFPCQDTPVCMDGRYTLSSECTAQAAIRNGRYTTITKFQACETK